MKKLYYFLTLIILVAGFSACQKDDSVKDSTKSQLKADSAKMFATLSAQSGNTLAVKGTLTVTIQDSTYTFDAAKDSVAFVNVYMDGKNYFGITAINKAHTMTFGISAPGYAAAQTNVAVAGSQFLLNASQPIQFSLSQHPNLPSSGSISLDKFSSDSVLAKGTFTAFLAKNDKPTADYYPAKGSFTLFSK